MFEESQVENYTILPFEAEEFLGSQGNGTGTACSSLSSDDGSQSVNCVLQRVIDQSDSGNKRRRIGIFQMREDSENGNGMVNNVVRRQTQVDRVGGLMENVQFWMRTRLH